jgi:acyl-CoA thioesterase-1
MRFSFLFLAVFACSTTFCNSAPKQSATEAPQPVAESETPPAKKPVILFFGDSITAGYGLEPAMAFPALIQTRLDSLGYAYNVVNAGLSGETSAGGLRRIEWVLKANPSIFFLELGGNDGLRGVSLEQTRENLKGIIAKVRAVNPDCKIVLAGMQLPPNLGADYVAQFQALFPDLARSEKTALIPFILEGVGGDPALNLPDMIHPNAEGHKIVAETVWKLLKNLVEKPAN